MAIGALLNPLEYAFFSAAAGFIDAAVAAVLLELWPILLVLLAAWLFRRDQVYRQNTRSIVPLAIVALAGFAFVVGSQSGGFNVEGSHFSGMAIGVALALLSAVAGACAAFIFRWGRDLPDKLPSRVTNVRSNLSLQVFGATLGSAIVSFAGAFLSSGIGLATGESLQSGAVEYLGYAFLTGVLILSTSALLFRLSNLLTDNLGINALGYAIPAISLVWLAIFWDIEVSRPDFLVIGTAAIISANLLINFEAERLLGFKALVISLWACGTFVYLRSTESWHWLGKSDAYFDVLFLSSTVFALILSFRVVRLASRTQEEDNRAFKLFRELEELEVRGVIRGNPSTKVIEMDEKGGRELEAAYVEARLAINRSLISASDQDREKLRKVESELDMLAHSRQQGINFGEICALFIFAGLVVGTALLSRPAQVQGLTGFLVEMFAMLFPAVIVFLTFNVLDLQRDRVARILEASPQYQGYGVAFQDTVREGGRLEHSGRRTAEQWISVAVGIALIVAYPGLFLHKWGLWPQVQNSLSSPFF